jgi:hypothetical protein
MKLNLLPQTVSKGRALRTGYVFGTLILILALLASGWMTFSTKGPLDEQLQRVDSTAQSAADAVATGAQKDEVISSASTVIRNATLAQDMIEHNDVYPDLYTDIQRYVPSFFRLTSLSAQPIDENTATVTLVGTLETYQQYADLMLALMRDKDVTSISRTGFTLSLPEVPALTTADQKGTPHKLGEPTLPEGQIDRLHYFESQNYQPAGYIGQGGYGSGADDTKGPTPKESLITIVLTVNRKLEVPDISRTLHSGGAGSSSAAPAGFGGMTTPGMGGGPPPGMAGPSMLSPGGGAAGGSASRTPGASAAGAAGGAGGGGD